MNNIVITGFSGTGKSIVGRAVARLLAWEFIDTDQEVVRQSGKSIVRLFEEDGEEAFRALERTAVQEACSGDRRVVSTGGGAIVDPGNFQLMSTTGFLVCLEATPATIYARLQAEQKATFEAVIRPMLQSESPLERIRMLKDQREAAYTHVQWTVHTDGLSVEEVTQEVLRAWRRLRRFAGA